MKKILFLAILMLTAAITLTSCGKDEPKQKTTATTTYHIALSQDLLDAANVFVVFKAENGRSIQESITDPWWSKSVTSDKFPAEFGVKFIFYAKTEAELTKDKYDLSCELNFNCKTSKGALYANTINVMEDIKEPVAKKKVIKTLEDYDGTIYGFKITEDGKPTVDNKMKF